MSQKWPSKIGVDTEKTHRKPAQRHRLAVREGMQKDKVSLYRNDHMYKDGRRMTEALGEMMHPAHEITVEPATKVQKNRSITSNGKNNEYAMAF